MTSHNHQPTGISAMAIHGPCPDFHVLQISPETHQPTQPLRQVETMGTLCQDFTSSGPTWANSWLAAESEGCTFAFALKKARMSGWTTQESKHSWTLQQGKRCLLWNISGRGEQRIKNYWKMLGHGSWRLGPLIASSSCSHDCNPLALPSVPNSLDPRLNTHAPKQNEHRMNMNKQYLPRMATPISSAEWRMCNIPWIRMCCKYNLPGIKHIVKPCKTIQCCSSDKPAFSARCSQSKPASTSPAWRGCGCVFALGTWHAKLLLTKSSIASIDYELCIKLTTA